MIDKKQLIEELLECVQDATDTETKITGLTMCATLFESVLDEAINYSQCCETLKDKETPTFEEWLDFNDYEYASNEYIRYGKKYVYSDLKLKYTEHINNL